MENSDLIAMLVAIDSIPARKAFRHDRNKSRYLPPARTDDKQEPSSTAVARANRARNTPDSARHRLILSLKKPPKSPKDGFVFGYGDDCDVQILDPEEPLDENADGGDRKPKISPHHFSITFDRFHRLVLHNRSADGMIVSYNGRAQTEQRSYFAWLLGRCANLEVNIPSARFTFMIRVAPHITRRAEYLNKINAMFPRSLATATATPCIDRLRVLSSGASLAPSEAASPNQAPIYIGDTQIGAGGFGKVYRVMDVTSGEIYAAKSITIGDLANEVAILRNMRNKHIIGFVDVVKKPALLIMEYAAGGSLHNYHDLSPIGYDDTLTILHQTSNALSWMHTNGYVHRDVKPDNILIWHSAPLFIKLADLGVTKHDCGGQTMPRTEQGTMRYKAPEIRGWKPYTSAVDIWSLAVMALELAYGLHWSYVKDKTEDEWVDFVIDYANKVAWDPLIQFVRSAMLLKNPRGRLSASQCEAAILQIQNDPSWTSSGTSSIEYNGSETEIATTSGASAASSVTIHKPPDSPIIPRRATQFYPIAHASIAGLDPRGSVYESIVALLRDIRDSDEEVATLATHGWIQGMQNQLRQLDILEIKRERNEFLNGFAILAITDEGMIPLGLLTGEDLALPMEELVHCLYQLLLCCGTDPKDFRERNRPFAHMVDWEGLDDADGQAWTAFAGRYAP